jgi:hypothetical protein
VRARENALFAVYDYSEYRYYIILTRFSKGQIYYIIINVHGITGPIAGGGACYGFILFILPESGGKCYSENLRLESRNNDV